MNKKEFLESLSQRLSLLRHEDMENAVEFYKEYFDEAGEEAESSIVEELGSPEKLAEEILSFYKASYSGENKQVVKKLKKGDISNLAFEIYSSSICVETSPSDIFEYKFINIKEEDIEVKIEDGTFSLREKTSEFFSKKLFTSFFKNFSMNFFGNKAHKRKIYIYIPAAMKIEKGEFNSRLGSVKLNGVKIFATEISLTCGSLSINDFQSEKLNLSTAAGSIKLIDVKSHYIKTYTAAGSIKFEDVDAQEVISSTGAGNIYFSDMKTEFFQASSGAGNIKCNDVKTGVCNINTGAGNCIITDPDFKKTKISSGAGNIKVKGLLKGVSDISSSMGSVALDLQGSLKEYYIRFNTNRFDVMLSGKTFEIQNKKEAGNIDAENKISVTVQSGSINIRTEDE